MINNPDFWDIKMLKKMFPWTDETRILLNTQMNTLCLIMITNLVVMFFEEIILRKIRRVQEIA